MPRPRPSAPRLSICPRGFSPGARAWTSRGRRRAASGRPRATPICTASPASPSSASRRAAGANASKARCLTRVPEARARSNRRFDSTRESRATAGCCSVRPSNASASPSRASRRQAASRVRSRHALASFAGPRSAATSRWWPTGSRTGPRWIGWAPGLRSYSRRARFRGRPRWPTSTGSAATGGARASWPTSRSARARRSASRADALPVASASRWRSDGGGSPSRRGVSTTRAGA